MNRKEITLGLHRKLLMVQKSHSPLISAEGLFLGNSNRLAQNTNMQGFSKPQTAVYLSPGYVPGVCWSSLRLFQVVFVCFNGFLNHKSI